MATKTENITKTDVEAPDIDVIGVDAKLYYEIYKFSKKVRSGLQDDPHILKFEQSLKVAEILVNLELDQTAVVTGFLYDLYAYPDILKDIRKKFGAKVHKLIVGYGKINDLTHQAQIEGNEEEYVRMVLSVAEDLRAVFLFIADRYFKIVNIDDLPQFDREILAKRTLSWYAPLIHRLGLGKFKSEIENLAFKLINPDSFSDLSEELSKKLQKWEHDSSEIMTFLKNHFKEVGISAKLSERTKAILSLHRKMERTDRPFDKIYDIFAIRAIVDTVADCYKILAISLQYYKPILEEFDDYIQKPKPNGYQSIHVLLEDDKGLHFELQIRTEEMHQTAEYGVAAHWKYKEEKKDNDTDGYFRWLREHIDYHGELSGEKAFTKFFNLKELTTDIFAITPKGDLKRLPKGSTPLDFAFSIHREVGVKCNGVKVNGQMVPFNTELHSGDCVEVLTANRPMVNSDWIKLVKSTKARSEIRRWTRKLIREQSIKLGEEILARGFRKSKVSWTREALNKLCVEFSASTVEDLFAAVGSGKLGVQAVTRKLSFSDITKKTALEEPEPALVPDRAPPEGVSVGGMESLMVNFGKCCMPIPGDSIIGYITRGKGVTVHRDTCRNIHQLKLEPERKIEVTWEDESEKLFVAGLKLVISKTDNFIKDISPKFTAGKSQLLNYQMYLGRGKEICVLVIKIPDATELNAVVKSLNNMKTVIEVTRLQYSEYKSLIIPG